MDFLELRERCIVQGRKTLDAICVGEDQRTAAIKAIGLITDSTFAGRDGDEQSAKLLVNSAFVLAGDTFGQSAQTKWDLLGQISRMTVECIDAFSAGNIGWIHFLLDEGYDEKSVAGLIDVVVRKKNSVRFCEEEAKKTLLLALEAKIVIQERKKSIASKFDGAGSLMLFMFWTSGIPLAIFFGDPRSSWWVPLPLAIGAIGVVFKIIAGKVFSARSGDATCLEEMKEEYAVKKQEFDNPK